MDVHSERVEGLGAPDRGGEDALGAKRFREWIGIGALAAASLGATDHTEWFPFCRSSVSRSSRSTLGALSPARVSYESRFYAATESVCVARLGGGATPWASGSR